MFYVTGDKVIHKGRSATVEKSDPFVKSQNNRPARIRITLVYDDDGSTAEVAPEELARK